MSRSVQETCGQTQTVDYALQTVLLIHLEIHLIVMNVWMSARQILTFMATLIVITARVSARMINTQIRQIEPANQAVYHSSNITFDVWHSVQMDTMQTF